MSLRTFSDARKNLVNLFAVFFLCLGYFNYFLIKEPILFFFQISSLTGQVLVNKFISICNCTVEILKLTYLFFQILYEDSLIFLKDATEKFAFSIYLLKELYIFLEEFVLTFLNTVSQILGVFVRFLEFFQCTVGTLKEGIQLTGSAIWRAVTNIPEIVVLNVSAVNEFIKISVIEFKFSVFRVQEKVTESLEKSYEFLFDVPFDSVCGLVIGTVLVTILCIQFKNICYLLSSAFLKLYQQAVSLGICLWSGRFLEQNTRRYVDNNSEDDERLCIVCQHQLKEIIIFPCKHLCLCGDCTNQLTKSHPVCPVCRSNITGTLKVYI